MTLPMIILSDFLLQLPPPSPKRENGVTNPNISLKQRVNSVVMKALAINSEMGRAPNPR
jgi:hypothetical protein